MSQPSSSIISADNAEIKYKKALKQISKLISANRALRESNEKNTRDLKEKIDELSLRYEDLIKEYQNVRGQKESVSRYLDQLEKQRNQTKRQMAILNEALQQQSTELNKFKMHKDQRAVAALIRTYEEKQAIMNRNRNQNQQMIGKLKSTVQRLQNQLQYERTSKEEYQDRYKALSLEMNRYKQQNSSLLGQIQRLIKDGSQKDTYCVEKQKQLRLLLSEFQKQVGMLRSAQEQSYKQSKSLPDQNYQNLINEKNRMSIDLAKLQTAYEQLMMREKQFYEMEEKMKSAKLQADRAHQEVNMLKSKIVVLQAKQFLQEAGDDDYDQKQFEERLNLLVTQNDPLNSIRNQQDTTHFRILKAFIVDLQDKIYKVNGQKKEVSKKYKSIKTKFVKNAQQLTFYEQQNKVMKGKLEGYERLTEKLQFELEKALAGHEQQITRMTITSNNIITRKVQQYKSTINLLNSQLEMNLDKADRTEKNYKQQIQTLKLELDTLKIKYKDQSDKSNKDTEIIQLYKRKNNQLSAKIGNMEDQLSNTNDNLSRFQHLFKQQKGKNEGLLAQKQQLLAQTRQLSEQLDKKSSNVNNNFKIKQQQYEFEIRKLKSDSQKLRDQLQVTNKNLVSIQRDLEDKRKGQFEQIEQIKRQSQKISQLQLKISELKRKIRDLQDQNESLKIKTRKYQQTYEKTNKFEQENITKGDRINDLSREKILLESEIKNLQNQLNDERKQNQQFKKELSGLKMKALEENHENKRQYQSKLFEGKKNTQTLNQQISDLTTQLRDQKSKNLRINNELNTVKAQKNRLQQLIQQNRKKEWQNESQVGNIKLDLSNAQMEVQRLRSQIKNQQFTANNLNQEIQNMQQKIFSLNQQISNLKMKLQSAQDSKSDLIKDLNSLKYNFGLVQSHSNQARSNTNLAWNEQNFYSSLNDILIKIRKIFRNYGIQVDNAQIATTFNYQSIQVPSYTSAAANTSSRTQVRVEETANKGNNSYLDYFKSYADPTQEVNTRSAFNASSYLRQGGFENNLGTAKSIGIGKVDYTYSASNFESPNLSSYNESKAVPSYDYGQGTSGYNYNDYKSDINFNFSGLSKADGQ